MKKEVPEGYFRCLYCGKIFKLGYNEFKYKDGYVCRKCHFENGEGAGTRHFRGKRNKAYVYNHTKSNKAIL